MRELPPSLAHHRVRSDAPSSVLQGRVGFSPVKAAWFLCMAGATVVGGLLTFSLDALLLFLATTGAVLLFGHSLGSHRKLIHGSFQCPQWLEYLLVWMGMQVGLAGPIGLLRQHELRDYAQRLPECHDYLRHGRSFWVDAWWQLCCELVLDAPPRLVIEPRIAQDRFFRFLERTWMAQQLLPAALLFAWGGWAYVIWGTCARVTAGVLGHWLIGHFAHNEGGMHYRVEGAAVQGRNIRFTSLLTMGESWHNNHHAFPGSARLGLFAGEWDPGWWALLLLHKLGLVWGLRLPADLPVRSELHACSARAVAAPAQDSPPSTPIGPGVWLEGPAATLSATTFRRLLGPRTAFRPNPSARRLTLYGKSLHLQGLPALLTAIGLRHPVLRWAGLGMMPLARAFEGLRDTFSRPG